MKLITMVGDETWFWVWNDDTRVWEAFYEFAEEPARRLVTNDAQYLDEVFALLRDVLRVR